MTRSCAWVSRMRHGYRQRSQSSWEVWGFVRCRSWHFSLFGFRRKHPSAPVNHAEQHGLPRPTMEDGTGPMAGDWVVAAPGNWPCPQTVGMGQAPAGQNHIGPSVQTPDLGHRARLGATTAPHAGDWLLALPVANCGLKLDDEAITVAVGLRLGTPLCEPHRCPCGAPVASDG